MPDIRVLTGDTVDVISPFPPACLDRLVKWSYQYRSLVSADHGPQTNEELYEMYTAALSRQITYGVVDKHNTIGVPNPTGPIVIGAFIVEDSSPTNSYIHVVSQRSAWGKGLMDEGGDIVVADMFAQHPQLLRLSAYMQAGNNAAIEFTKRRGFTREGFMRDMFTIKGKPKNIVHYGLTRKDYEAGHQPAPQEE